LPSNTAGFLAVDGVLQGPSRSTTAYAEQRPLSDSLMRELKPGDRPFQTIAVQTMVMSLPGAAGDTHQHLLYFGPAEYGEVGHYGAISRAVELGWPWIRPISAMLLKVLNGIHRVVGNYGWAIILLATLIRVVLHPLNMTSMRSMRAMQRLQPELDRLREKYKNDPTAMNTAMMALYKENKVNPAGGCLPMVLQMPVLIALYQVLFNAIELRQAPFIGWITDLSAPDLLFRIGPLPVRLLPILMAGSGLLQQRMTPTPPQQAPTAYMMNVMMLWFFYGMPSGLVLYWTVMNLLSALQQWMVLRGDSGPSVVVREVAAAPPARRGKSGRGVAGKVRSG
jgi:YidC/Oxa1 family membrane protein insertase